MTLITGRPSPVSWKKEISCQIWHKKAEDRKRAQQAERRDHRKQRSTDAALSS